VKVFPLAEHAKDLSVVILTYERDPDMF